MLVILLIVLLIIAVFAFLALPQFAKLPSGARLRRIKQSKNYENGQFQNASETPAMATEGGMFAVLKQFLFDKKRRVKPIDIIPSAKTDLLNSILVIEEELNLKTMHNNFQIGGRNPVNFFTKLFSFTDLKCIIWLKNCFIISKYKFRDT